MLQTIDVLIGFALVMLILSAMVTALVQWVVTTLLNLKGKVLKEGIAQLLHLLDKTRLPIADARHIADYLLTSDLVGKDKLLGQGKVLAGAIHREELTKLILAFAAGADLKTGNPATATQGDVAGLRAKLLAALDANGIADPGAALDAVRTRIVELEQARPELANDVRQSLALAEHATSRFLAKLNAWFDQTIDRTVDTFTTQARMTTTLVALAVALFFQADSFQLLGRLSTDRQATATLVNAAITTPQQFAKPAGAGPATGPAPAPAPADALKAIGHDPQLKKLVDTNLIAWPSSFPDWYERSYGSPDEQGGTTVYGFLSHLFGILLTMGLLTLGAPTWYAILKNLIGLRSVTARKDDEQRTVRQTNQP